MEGLEKAIEQIKENMPKLDLREHEPMRTHCSFKVSQQIVRSTSTANLTVRTISTRITRRTIRFPSYICQSATTDG